MRGKDQDTAVKKAERGITPAYAGKRNRAVFFCVPL